MLYIWPGFECLIMPRPCTTAEHNGTFWGVIIYIIKDCATRCGIDLATCSVYLTMSINIFIKQVSMSRHIIIIIISLFYSK